MTGQETPNIAAQTCSVDPHGEGIHAFADDHICIYCGKIDMHHARSVTGQETPPTPQSSVYPEPASPPRWLAAEDKTLWWADGNRWQMYIGPGMDTDALDALVAAVTDTQQLRDENARLREFVEAMRATADSLIEAGGREERRIGHHIRRRVATFDAARAALEPTPTHQEAR